jgi:hypothetical protein|tara:strand:+ start:321 stop:2954 length:2634 start_codon:yes stop_codon:yes gene_type:complete
VKDIRQWLDNEKNVATFLVVGFLLISAWIVSQPHDLQFEGHLKDEEAYYPWAELYLDGYYSLPMDKANGVYGYQESITVDSDAPPLQVEHTITDLDKDGQNDDLNVEVSYENGDPVAGATVYIPIQGGERIESTTNGAGEAQLYDIPFGTPPLIVELEREGEPRLIVRTNLEATTMGQARYGVTTLTTVEFLSDRTLGGLLEAYRTDGTPATDIEVRFNGQLKGNTDEQGHLEVGDLDQKRGNFELREEGESASNISVVLDERDLGQLDINGRVQVKVVERTQFSIHAQDLFGMQVEGAVVTLLPLNEELGTTSQNGTLTIVKELELNVYQIKTDWDIEGYDPPMVSGIAPVEDEYHFVNHWPPGPSVVLMPLIVLGLEELFGTLMAAMTCIATYGLGRRWWGWRTAALATVFTYLNSVILMLQFGQWMGDLAAVAFALPGFWLVVEATHLSKKDVDLRLQKVMGLTILGGVLIGIGVTMRYTTVLVSGSPFLYIGWYNLPDGDTKEFWSRLKTALSWPRVKEPLMQAGALTMGLLLIGIPLAMYNDTYFGGPLNSGYQSKNVLEVSSEGGNITVETHEPAGTMWEGYVNLGDQEVENLGQVARFVIAFFPALLVIPPGIWVARRTAPANVALIYWLGVTIAIYLTQGWVLNNTYTDIRYYLPLAPPLGLLAARGILTIGKSMEYGNVAVGLVSLLIVASGTTVFLEAEEDLQTRWTRMNNSPNQQQTIETNIDQLVANPQDFYDQKVHIGGGDVVEIIGPSAVRLADPVHPGSEIQFILGPNQIELEVGDRIQVTAMFRVDNHPNNPDGHGLFLQNEEDLQFVQIQMAAEAPPPGGSGERPKLSLTPVQARGMHLGILSGLVINGLGLVVYRNNRF